MCTVEPDCGLCGPDKCTPVCGLCSGFQLVEYIEGGTSYGRDQSLRQMRERLGIGMGKKFSFTEGGIGSKGYYLHHILNGATSANSLKVATHRQWYDANEALRQLVAFQMVENKATSTYPRFEVTDLGLEEIERFKAWRGTAPEHPKIGPVVDAAISLGESIAAHNVPQTPALGDKPLQHIPELPPESIVPPAAVDPKPSNIKKLPDGSPVGQPPAAKSDPYHDAFVKLLIERFGGQITFVEVLDRIQADAAL